MSIETIAPQIMVNGKIYAIISQDDLAALRARIAELERSLLYIASFKSVYYGDHECQALMNVAEEALKPPEDK